MPDQRNNKRNRQNRSPSVEVTSGTWSKRRRNAKALKETNTQKANLDNVKVDESEFPIDMQDVKRNEDFPKTWEEIKDKYKIIRIVDKISGKVLTNDHQVYRTPTTLTKIMEDDDDDYIVVNYAEYYWKIHGQILHRDTMLIRCDGLIVPIENIIGVCKKADYAI